jgi:hypothetical protein
LDFLSILFSRIADYGYYRRLYFEMQTPGIGFPLGVAILAAVLYFAPLYLEGLAANWEILYLL